MRILRWEGWYSPTTAPPSALPAAAILKLGSTNPTSRAHSSPARDSRSSRLAAGELVAGASFAFAETRWVRRRSSRASIASTGGTSLKSRRRNLAPSAAIALPSIAGPAAAPESVEPPVTRIASAAGRAAISNAPRTVDIGRRSGSTRERLALDAGSDVGLGADSVNDCQSQEGAGNSGEHRDDSGRSNRVARRDLVRRAGHHRAGDRPQERAHDATPEPIRDEHREVPEGDADDEPDQRSHQRLLPCFFPERASRRRRSRSARDGRLGCAGSGAAPALTGSASVTSPSPPLPAGGSPRAGAAAAGSGAVAVGAATAGAGSAAPPPDGVGFVHPGAEALL